MSGDLQTNNMNTFCPKLNPFNENLKIPFVVEQLNVTLDVSGSTNNNYGGRNFVRGVRYTRFDTSQNTEEMNTPPPLSTKIIYLAELEGLAHFLAETANRYDMTNIQLNITTFSALCNPGYNLKLESSLQLYNLAQTLDKKLILDFGSTNLTDAIVKTIEDKTKSTIMVILSDGQPNDRVGVVHSMFHIVEDFKHNGKILHMLSIGAGSIKDASSGEQISSSRRGFTRFSGLHPNIAINQEAYDRYLQSLGSYGSECDKNLLVFVSEFATGINFYMPACQDYSLIKKGTSDFYDKIEALDDDVKLYSIDTDHGTVVLPEEAQNIMKVLKKTARDFGYIKNDFGEYILSTGEYGNEPYQLRVSEIKDYVSKNQYKPDKMITVCFLENISLEEKSNVFNLYSTVKKSIKCDPVFVAVLPDGSKKYYKPDTIKYTSDMGFEKTIFRVRKLKCD